MMLILYFVVCQQTRSQLWSEVAEKITIAVQQIIEFAKMLPGFMDLSQDDQIMLLKAGTEWVGRIQQSQCL